MTWPEAFVEGCKQLAPAITVVAMCATVLFLAYINNKRL